MVAPANGSPETPRELTLDNLQPTSDWIIAIKLNASETPSNIVFPDDVDMGMERYIVLAVGPGRICEMNPQLDGRPNRHPMDCEPGDVVRIKGGEYAEFYVGNRKLWTFQNWQIHSLAPLEKLTPEQYEQVMAGDDLVRKPKPKLLKV